MSRISNEKLLTRCCGIALLLACTGCAGTGATAAASADDNRQERTDVVQDAWIDTRLETAYLFNRHLNNFNIQTDVDNGVVLLTGTVRSDIDKDLAEEIALSVKGVDSVINRLVVKESLEASRRRGDDADFGQKVNDATTTARVKTRLIANENLEGRAIDVNTRNSVVTLAGDVRTDEQKQLAELIAKNTPEVQSVANELQVRSSTKGG